MPSSKLNQNNSLQTMTHTGVTARVKSKKSHYPEGESHHIWQGNWRNWNWIRKNKTLEELEGIYKFSNSHALKLIFTQTYLQWNALKLNLKPLTQVYHEIKQETYIRNKRYMKCYTLEKHFTNQCPKHSEYKTSSEWSIDDYLWHQCIETIKKYINCDEGHSPFAMKCKKGKKSSNKKILKKKMKTKCLTPA